MRVQTHGVIPKICTGTSNGAARLTAPCALRKARFRVISSMARRSQSATRMRSYLLATSTVFIIGCAEGIPPDTADGIQIESRHSIEGGLEANLIIGLISERVILPMLPRIGGPTTEE